MVRMDYGGIYGFLTINNFRSKTVGKRKSVTVTYKSLVMTKVQIKPS
jgi:hypothetical protein